MTETKHTPTPWKVVSTPNFDSGLVYTSIQPVTVDEEAMKPLAMANGEYHVCRMSHSAAPWRFDYHRADAAFIVEAVNSYAALQAEVARLIKNAESNAKLLSSYHALVTKLSAAPRTSDLYAFRDYKPGSWAHVNTVDEMQEFYLSRLQAIRLAAHEHGYAIGVHGSQRRDFDLMAMQWREGASDKDALAHAIAEAACGISQDGPYRWEQKPLGRVATSFPICWTAWSDMVSAGHIDLSLAPTTENAPLKAEVARLREALETASVWLRNGDYDTRGGLIEMDRIATVCEKALEPRT